MNNKRKLLVGVLVALLLTAGVVWFVGTGAPDCSRVSYDGDGTEANPYEVSNVEQLQCIKKFEDQDLSSNYTQVSDIDASETSSWNGGKGFESIGMGGTYDGQGYNITGLTINLFPGPGLELAGMFGSNSGKITNVSLVNAEVILRHDGDSTFHAAGALVASNEGTVSNSYATGEVEGRELNYITRGGVGGLVGDNDGTVKKSYASVSVDASRFAGGLVGRNSDEGVINKSYATGSVNGSNPVDKSIVGGFVGSNGGKIRSSYATGSVEGDEDVGGLVGSNTGGIIDESYATGSVNGSEDVGGLVGYHNGADGGRVSDSYWDMNTTGQPTSAGGTGLNTSEMTSSAARGNMTGFDFTDTWRTVPGGYPELRKGATTRRER